MKNNTIKKITKQIYSINKILFYTKQPYSSKIFSSQKHLKKIISKILIFFENIVDKWK